MESTPHSLLERVRQRSDQEAWSRFVKLYTPLIFYWGQKCGLQPEDAADLTQEVFAILLEKLPGFTYDQHKSFRGWLRTVTLNRWRDRVKGAATRPLPGDEVKLAELAAVDRVSALEDDEYQQHLVARALALMQSEFQPTTWKACWEFVVQGRSAAEVARELGLTESAVYVAKFRVVRRLKEELKGLLEE